MGLDIRVYKNIKETTQNEEYDFHSYVSIPEWEYKIKNLTINGFYFGEIQKQTVGYPYSAHSRFRESLLKLTNNHDVLDSEGEVIWDKLNVSIPFYELINFSDCEGCLDWEISEKIYNDFEKYLLDAKINLSDYQFEVYKDWMSCFDVARDKGVVVFS